MRTHEVYAALHFLAQRSGRKWAFDQFRSCLDNPVAEGFQAEGRRQLASASLNPIRLAIKESRHGIELQVDALARRYKNTHDRKVIEQVNELSRRLRELEID